MPSYSDASMRFEKTEYICKFRRARIEENFYLSTYLFIFLSATAFLTKSFQVLRLIISEVGRRDEMALKCLVDIFG